MGHPNHGEAKSTQRAKMERIAGKHGEYPPDRAERIAKVGGGQAAQGDAAKMNEEIWNGAPPRQVSNYGNRKGD